MRRRRSCALAAGRLACLVILLWPASPGSARSTESTDDAALRERIESRIADLPDSAGADVQVVVQDGLVVLQGRVRLLDQSLRAERTAWKTPGVLEVENELRVLPAEVGGDAAILHQVRVIVKGDGRFLDTHLSIEVEGGVVRIRGFFQDPSDVLDLKHRVASILGVLEIEIDAQLVASRVAERAMKRS